MRKSKSQVQAFEKPKVNPAEALARVKASSKPDMPHYACCVHDGRPATRHISIYSRPSRDKITCSRRIPHYSMLLLSWIKKRDRQRKRVGGEKTAFSIAFEPS